MKPTSQKLDRSIPMVLGERGIYMVFACDLNKRQRRRAFDLFHLASAIETPSGVYFRPDDMKETTDCLASRVYLAINKACKQWHKEIAQ